MNKMETSSGPPTGRQKLQIKKQPNWNQFNYPPLFNLMHFRPSQLPQDKKALVLMLFSVHIAIFLISFLSFIDNCIEGGLGILYAILFLVIINPIGLFLFYRAYMGIMRDKGMLRLFFIIQPLVIIVEIIISIVDFLGFNGFIRVAYLFNNDQALSGIISLVVSLGYDAIAIFSSFLYYRVYRQKSVLTKALL